MAVERRFNLRTDRYDNTPGELVGTMYSIPLRTAENKLVIMQALKHEIPPPNETIGNLPNWTVIIMGGGASGALENAGMIKRTAEAARYFESNHPEIYKFRVGNVISVSHPQGTAREQKIIDDQNFVNSAKLVMQTILDKELGVEDSAGFILWGFSAGGPVMIEVAQILQEKNLPYKLVLAEPVGTSKHSDLSRKVIVDTNADIFRHFYQLWEKIPMNERPPFSRITKWFEIAQQGYAEILNSMTTPDGAPSSILELIWEMTYRGQDRLDRLAMEFGLPKSIGGVMPNGTLFERDVTSAARQEIRGQVILVSSVFAKVANLLVAHGFASDSMLNALWSYWTHKRMGDKLQVYKELQKFNPMLPKDKLVSLVHELTGEGYIQNTYLSIAQKLFPYATVKTFPVFTGLHSGMMRFSDTHAKIFELLHQ